MISTDLGNLFSGTAEALWQLGKEKDAVAWSKIVKMHSTGMLHTAKGVLGDHFLAEDAVQNALLQIRDLSAEYFRRENDESSNKLFSHHQKENTIFKNDFAARNWIIRITYFVAKNMKKSLVLAKEREKVFTQHWVEERESRLAPDQEMLAVLQTEIEKLPEELRLPLVLRFHCDLNFNQVSSELGLAVHVIRKRVEKGIEVLQTKLASIVGSTMPAVSVESLLKNMVSFNEGLSDSLVKSCADLLDKPALTKLQLIPENKLLLQSSKFMVKGLVMLKVLSVLVMLIITAMLVVNSIQSNESSKSKETKEKELALEKISKENIASKKKAEDLKLLNSKEDKGNESILTKAKPNNLFDAAEINPTNKSELSTASKKEKSEEFDINEILPYFSDKAMFTLIMPDLNRSVEQLRNSTVSKFYNDPSIDFLGKIPLILQLKFNLNLENLSGSMVKKLMASIFLSFHCMGFQYLEDAKTKSSSIVLVGLLKEKEETGFTLLLETLKPFQRQTQKTGSGSVRNTYQFAEGQSLFVLVKNENKIFFGTGGGSWEGNIENKTAAKALLKDSMTSDIFWKLDVKAIFEKFMSARDQKRTPLLWDALGFKFLDEFTGEIIVQPGNITHKIDVALKGGNQRGIWDILALKNITQTMLGQIPTDRVAYTCFNIDLQKSWENYNAFMTAFMNQFSAIEEGAKEQYAIEFGKTNEIFKTIFQMDLESMMTKCLTGEIVCWITTTTPPIQTMRFGVKQQEYTKKLASGLESIYGKTSGIKIGVDDKYLTLSFSVPQNAFNLNYRKTSLSTDLPDSDLLKKNFTSWQDIRFSPTHSLKFLFNIIFNQRQLRQEGKPQSDELQFLGLLNDSIKCNATSFVFTKDHLKIELEGFDDFIQLVLLGILGDKNNQNYSETSPQYTELKGITYIKDKSTEYISAKGYLLKGVKNGHWTFLNEKGEIESEGNYSFGKETGFWKKTISFNEKAEGEMENGLQTGQWTINDLFWVTTSIGEMKLGKKNGLWKSYHKNKKLSSEGEYNEDKKVNLWKYYHDNGAKSHEEFYNQKGELVLEGEFVQWDELGNISFSCIYSKGKLDGLCKMFSNQQLKTEEEYENGLRIWSKSYYLPLGNIEREFSFEKENSKGYDKVYFPNGQIKLKKQNLMPIKEGVSQSVIPTGEWQEWYESNAKKMVATFDKEGSGLKTVYFENGFKCTEYCFQKGSLDGKVEGWYNNGNPFFSGFYGKGKISGRWTVWYLNGNKKAEGEFKDGTIYPGWKIWEKNGELKEEIEFSLTEVLINTWKFRNRLIAFASEFHYLINFWDVTDIPHLMVQIQAENGDSPKK